MLVFLNKSLETVVVGFLDQLVPVRVKGSGRYVVLVDCELLERREVITQGRPVGGSLGKDFQAGALSTTHAVVQVTFVLRAGATRLKRRSW